VSGWTLYRICKRQLVMLHPHFWQILRTSCACFLPFFLHPSSLLSQCRPSSSSLFFSTLPPVRDLKPANLMICSSLLSLCTPHVHFTDVSFPCSLLSPLSSSYLAEISSQPT
jgi:hypothetical protein